MKKEYSEIIIETTTEKYKEKMPIGTKDEKANCSAKNLYDVGRIQMNR